MQSANHKQTLGRRRRHPSRKERKTARRYSHRGRTALSASFRQPRLHNHRLSRFCYRPGRAEQQRYRFGLTPLTQEALSVPAHPGREHGSVAGARSGSVV